VEEHEFRDDLYYRLSVIPIYLAPLRERKEDIATLIDYFLQKFSEKLHRSLQTLDSRCQKLLLNYSWPGNIRELQNTIEYAINMTDEMDSIINVDSLPNRIIQNSASPIKSMVHSNAHHPDGAHESGKLKNMEIEAIQHALNMFGSTTEGKEMAAKYLGISIATLYRRLKELKKYEAQQL
jgi:transcriptional regulator with PAS, ATPase and Fis domain